MAHQSLCDISVKGSILLHEKKCLKDELAEYQRQMTELKCLINTNKEQITQLEEEITQLLLDADKHETSPLRKKIVQMLTRDEK